MGTRGDLRALIDARSIAIVGASADPKKLGYRPLALLRQHGFDGEMFPINPTRTDIEGMPCYPSLAAVGRPIDLALVLTSAADTEAAIEQGVAAGVRSFAVYASGFAEQDEAGWQRQQRIAALARTHGVAVLGPNCVGAMNARTRMCATIASVGELMTFTPGPFSFVSQSGAIGGYWLDKILKAGLGFSKWITSGNEADIGLADCVRYLADDPETRAIGLYLEAVRDPTALRRALYAAAQAGKPVLALRAGRSAAGATATASHTAGLAGDSEVCDAFLAQCGVQQVESLSAMIDASRMLVWGPAEPCRRPAVVSVSGGAGALMTDALSAAGLGMPGFRPEVAAAIERELPSFGRAANPLDLTGMVGAEPLILKRVLKPILAADDHDCVFVFTGLMHNTAPGLVESILTAATTRPRRLAVVWIGPPAFAVKALSEAQIPLFDDIPQAARALAVCNAARQSAQRLASPALSDVRSIEPRRIGLALTEQAGQQRMGALDGLDYPDSVRMIGGLAVDEAASILSRGPTVAKLQSPQVLHKTELGAIRLGITDLDALERARLELEAIAHRIGAESEGVLVQSMVEHDLQLIIGLRWDEVFGPVLLVGRGGTEVEAERDIALRVLPVSAQDIEDALSGLRLGPRLMGSRGRAAIDLAALSRALASLCQTYLARADIAEIEINPLALKAPGTFTVLDMLVRMNG